MGGMAVRWFSWILKAAVSLEVHFWPEYAKNSLVNDGQFFKFLNIGSPIKQSYRSSVEAQRAGDCFD